MKFLFALCMLIASGSAHAAQKGLGMWHFPGTKAQEVGAGWYYNWGPIPNEADDIFVPMIWGEKHLDSWSLTEASRASSPNLLGFNEPDGCDHGAQACMSAERALEVWPKLIATGKRLGSPAVAGNYGWLSNFMAGAQAKSYRVDFIAVHHYPDLADVNVAVAETLAIIDNVHAQYNLPVWLTEFGTLNAQPLARTKQFIDAILPQLDARVFVERYAWFSDHAYRGQSGSSVFDDNGNVTPVGEAYRDILTGEK